MTVCALMPNPRAVSLIPLPFKAIAVTSLVSPVRGFSDGTAAETCADRPYSVPLSTIRRSAVAINRFGLLTNGVGYRNKNHSQRYMPLHV